MKFAKQVRQKWPFVFHLPHPSMPEHSPNWYSMLLMMFVAHVDQAGWPQYQACDFWYFDHHWLRICSHKKWNWAMNQYSLDWPRVQYTRYTLKRAQIHSLAWSEIHKFENRDEFIKSANWIKPQLHPKFGSCFTWLCSPPCQKPSPNWYFMLLVVFENYVDAPGRSHCHTSDFGVLSTIGLSHGHKYEEIYGKWMLIELLRSPICQTHVNESESLSIGTQLFQASLEFWVQLVCHPGTYKKKSMVNECSLDSWAVQCARHTWMSRVHICVLAPQFCVPPQFGVLTIIAWCF